MNRRRFFQSLGAAILGTAIALKIPETLIPQSASVYGSDSWYTLMFRAEFTIKNPRYHAVIYGINC